MRGVQNLEGVALRVTGTVPLPLGDPSTQRSMNRVVAQQELERQNFRVRGSRPTEQICPDSAGTFHSFDPFVFAIFPTSSGQRHPALLGPRFLRVRITFLPTLY